MTNRPSLASLEERSTQRPASAAAARVELHQPPAQVTTAQRIGARLTDGEFDLTRRAFLSDLTQLGHSAPNSMGEWVELAIDAHNRKTPARRAAAVEALGELDTAQRRTRSWPVAVPTQVDAKDAIDAELRAGNVLSFAVYVSDAIRVATAASIKRAGGELPPAPPGPLPRRPNR